MLRKCEDIRNEGIEGVLPTTGSTPSSTSRATMRGAGAAPPCQCAAPGLLSAFSSVPPSALQMLTHGRCTADLLLRASGKLAVRVVDRPTRTRPASTGMGSRGEVGGGSAQQQSAQRRLCRPELAGHRRHWRHHQLQRHPGQHRRRYRHRYRHRWRHHHLQRRRYW